MCGGCRVHSIDFAFTEFLSPFACYRHIWEVYYTALAEHTLSDMMGRIHGKRKSVCETTLHHRITFNFFLGCSFLLLPTCNTTLRRYTISRQSVETHEAIECVHCTAGSIIISSQYHRCAWREWEQNPDTRKLMNGSESKKCENDTKEIGECALATSLE